ncbi:MAG: hypothetical protein NDJ24_10135 [Alphaproteobacteria bacterium]|nr:hypothetical protein [Alphaproteobacteria bacterium]
MNSFAKYSFAGLFAAAVMGSVVYQKEIGDALLTDEANAKHVLGNDPRFKNAEIAYTGYEVLGCLKNEWKSTGFVAKHKDGTQTSGVVCDTLFGTASSIRLK